MSDSTLQFYRISRVWTAVIGGFFLATIFFTGVVAFADDEKAGDIESRGMPQIQRPVQPGMAVTPGSQAQQKFQLPTWPQQLDVEERQPATFGLVVTQPGPLAVDVQWQGPPLDVTLRGPNQPPLVQRGQGNVRVALQVTPQDVQRSVLWVLQVALAPNTKGRAAGQVTVQHPPVNEGQAESAVRTRVEQAKQQSQLNPAQIQAHSQALLLARKNESDRQYQNYIQGTQRQLEAFMKQKGSQGQIRSRALKPLKEIPSGSRQNFQAILPSPRIDRLSVTQGPPGTVVIIEGSGFTGSPGFVHMTVNPTQELLAKVVGAPSQPVWSDGFIAVTVPELTGVTPFTANIFVSIGVDRSSTGPEYRSNLVPFNFVPRQQVRVVTRVTGDRRLAGSPTHFAGLGGGNTSGIVTGNDIHHARLDVLIPFMGHMIFFGAKGRDWFFENTILKNGWKFDCVEIIPYDFHSCRPSDNTVYGTGPGSGAYVTAGLGSASPQFAVDWWMDAFVPGMNYTYAFIISGPEGTADGIEVP